MASKTPLLRAIAQRHYAAGQAAAKPLQSAASQDVKSTVLPNKLIVTSVDNNSPLSRVSIFFRAGSRYETAENLGAAHFLRIIAGLTTKGASHFSITRNLQQYGANLTCQVGREHISYTLEATNDSIEPTVQYLLEIASKQAFKPWELADAVPRLKYELAGLSAPARGIDLLHKAAYRTGLGNSLYVASHNVGKISSETLQHYVNQTFTTTRGAVVGIGVGQDLLVPAAQSLALDSNNGPAASKPTFNAGEIRQEGGSSSAFIAIATEGASVSNAKDAIVYALLHRVAGAGPSVKWSNGASTSPIAKAACAAAENEIVAASGFNVSYSDSGLFGAVVAAPGNVAGKALEAVVRSLKSLSVSDADVKRAKAQLKAQILQESETGSGLSESIGLEAVLRGSVASASQVVSLVDGVSTSDVAAAAKKVAGGKFALAALGNISGVPYLDQLK
ncbi:cytochrome b-c1 complex subunit 2, mitochondrial [Neocloeon triangulifer]|uniref:cytochrome b-c1 complex subunit 2, mitochondrial n=1 Tax=Neocloeon triangulifer TaxID=2078957 RepID=UPI00286F91E0|nr:cytochrome b-c1 complex subunit 2, mitochondrial [Neocloeon triangulifer]